MLNPTASRGVTLTEPGNVYMNLMKRDIAPVEDKSRRFDSVELSADTNRAIAVPKGLVGQISQEVRATTTIGDIEALRKAVADGTYVPDPMKIAERMLFLVED